MDNEDTSGGVYDGGDEDEVTVGPPSINGSADTIYENTYSSAVTKSYSFSATNGSPVANAPITWSLSPTTYGNINGSGAITLFFPQNTTASGTFVVTASNANGSAQRSWGYTIFSTNDPIVDPPPPPPPGDGCAESCKAYIRQQVYDNMSYDRMLSILGISGASLAMLGAIAALITSLMNRTGPKGDDGTNGRNGTNGTNGANGKDGTNGANGANGKDGLDGRDAVGISFITQPTGSTARFVLSDGQIFDVLLPQPTIEVVEQRNALNETQADDGRVRLNRLNPLFQQASRFLRR
jgi:hypothetical protein